MVSGALRTKLVWPNYTKFSVPTTYLEKPPNVLKE